MFGSEHEITATIVHLLNTVLPSVMQSVLKVLMLLVVMSPVFMLDLSDVRYPPPPPDKKCSQEISPAPEHSCNKQTAFSERTKETAQFFISVCSESYTITATNMSNLIASVFKHLYCIW